MQISLIAAMTVDGFIGRNKDDRSFDWTSGADKAFYVEQLKQAEAIIMGHQTFSTFSRYPKNSNWFIYTANPEKFIKPSANHISVEATNLPAAELIAKLASQGKKKVLICGGSSIYTMFMKSGLVNKLYLTIEPVLFGDGVKLFSSQIDQTNLALLRTHQLSEQTIALEYEVRSQKSAV